MGFTTHTRYSADCDVRLDPNGVPFRPSREAWAAWSAAEAPDRGPLHEALGRACRTMADTFYANSAAAARRQLAALGWTFATQGRIRNRHFGWRAACPDHKGALDLPEAGDGPEERAARQAAMAPYLPPRQEDD